MSSTKTLPDALVTATNGLIASHIDTLVAHHYRVRSTDRSLARAQRMLPLFSQKYGNDALEFVGVPSITTPDCYDAAIHGATALHGAAALIHTACTMSLSGSPPP